MTSTGPVPGLAQVTLEEGSQDVKGERMVLTLPARSFCAIEAPIEIGD